MVLSVLVVLTAMRLPATLRWQRGLAMERAISIIQIQVQETRLAAIRSGEPWSLVLPQPGIPEDAIRITCLLLTTRRGTSNGRPGFNVMICRAHNFLDKFSFSPMELFPNDF